MVAHVAPANVRLDAVFEAGAVVAYGLADVAIGHLAKTFVAAAGIGSDTLAVDALVRANWTTFVQRVIHTVALEALADLRLRTDSVSAAALAAQWDAHGRAVVRVAIAADRSALVAYVVLEEKLQN